MAQKSTFSIGFVAQKGKVKSSGRCPIMARITVNGEVAHFSTKFDIQPDRWDSKEAKTLGKTKDEKEINLMLDDFRALVKGRYNEMTLRGEIVTASKLKLRVMNLDESCVKLLELCDNFIEDYYKLVESKDVTKCTFQRYVLTRNRLAEFLRSKYKLDDIPLADINHNFIKGFDLYNRSVHKSANNTAARFVKHFRTMFNMAINNGWINGDPFANYKIRLEKVNRGYLTQQELEAMNDKEITNKRLEVVKDMFLFSCYTGLAYIDVRQLTSANVEVHPDGTTWLVKSRQKTNNPFRLVLLDIPLQIIKKYEGQGDNGRLLPIPSNQKTNDYLKEIATLCEIDKNLTFHIARHTFATTIALENGVPLETVSKILGHTSTKTTQIYARITDNKIRDDMNLLAQKLNNKQARPTI